MPRERDNKSSQVKSSCYICGALRLQAQLGFRLGATSLLQEVEASFPLLSSYGAPRRAPAVAKGAGPMPDSRQIGHAKLQEKAEAEREKMTKAVVHVQRCTQRLLGGGGAAN